MSVSTMCWLRRSLWMSLMTSACLAISSPAWAQPNTLPDLDALFAPDAEASEDEASAEATPADAPDDLADAPLQHPRADAPAQGDASSVAGLPPMQLPIPEVPASPAASDLDQDPALPLGRDQAKDLAKDQGTRSPSQGDAKREAAASYRLEDAASPAPAMPALGPTAMSPRRVMPVQLVQQIFDDIQRERAAEVYDLRPYVRHEDWPAAIEAFERGKCSEALKTARDILGPESDRWPRGVSYMVARMQLCAKEAAAGRATLEALAVQDDGVGLLARRALGLRTPDLSTLLAATGPKASSPQAPPLEERLKALTRQGADEARLGQVIEELERLRAQAPRAADWHKITLAQAELLERHGQIEAAGRRWVGMMARARGSRHGAEVERAAQAFERRHKLELRDMSDRLDELRALIEAQDYKPARQLMDELTRQAKLSPQEAKGWGLYRQALEAERRRERAQADELFRRAEPLVEHAALRPRLYKDWARALRRLNKDMDAVALYRRLCAEHPQERALCAESLYQVGRLLQYENRFDEAFDAFFMLVGNYPEAPDLAEAHWRAALCAYLRQRYDEADSLWAEVGQRWGATRDTSGLPLSLRAHYWRGVIALKRGQHERALAMLQETIDQGPLTWYGRLAAARLKQRGVQPRQALPTARYTLQDLRFMEGLAVPRDPRLMMAEPLLRLGLVQEAAEEVRRYAWRSPEVVGAQAILAALHQVNKEYDKAHWMAQRFIKLSGPTANDLRVWATSYPLAYIEHVHKYAQQYGVSPFLALAIMRQESGFRPKVKSYAGALGLMQLMPGTARYTAHVFLDDASYKAKQIVEPETNIKLGTMYIRVHTAYAADRLPLALAGYNAGPAPLKRWFEAYKDRELDAWVESITFAQARGYVRKVMTSYIAYVGLYGDGALPELELTLPESLGKWGQLPELPSDAVSQRLDPVERGDHEFLAMMP